VTFGKLVGTAVVATTLWAEWPASTFAHGYLVRSYPAAKAHLAESPHHIRLVFSLKVDPGYSVVQLRDGEGAVLATEAMPQRSRNFSMPVPPLAPGRYHVSYRMLSPDGDFLEGRVDFVVGD